MHDLRPTTAFCWESKEAVSSFYVDRTTVIHSIQLSFSVPTASDAQEGAPSTTTSTHSVEGGSGLGLVLVRMVPHPHRLAGDLVYSACPPLVLTSFPFDFPARSSPKVSEEVLRMQVPQRWRIEGGTSVLLTVCTSETLEVAQVMFEEKTAMSCSPATRHTRTDCPTSSPVCSPPGPQPQSSFSSSVSPASRFPNIGEVPPTSPTAPRSPRRPLSLIHIPGDTFDDSVRTPACGFPARCVSVRLHGKSIGFPFSPNVPLMRPLLLHRWFELKPSIASEAAGLLRRPSKASQKLLRACIRRPGRKRHRSATLVEAEGGEEDMDGEESSRSDVDSSRGSDGGEPQDRLEPGQVKEAVALSANGRYIQWRDGSTGLLSEVTPYSHFFVVAASEKRSSEPVLDAPFAGSAVVGRLPPQLVVEAVGLQTTVHLNEGTQDTYAYVYHAAQSHLSDPDPTPRSKRRTEKRTRGGVDLNPAKPFLMETRGRRLWGWVKVSSIPSSTVTSPMREEKTVEDGPSATRVAPCPPTEYLKDVSGIEVCHGCRLIRTTLLSGMCNDVASGEPEEHLPDVRSPVMRALSLTFHSAAPRLYTVVGSDRGVRIRSEPSLLRTSSVLGVMEPNEVKEAAELMEIQPPAEPLTPHDSVRVFVAWRDEGYSLVRKGEREFLRPLTGVVLQPPSPPSISAGDPRPEGGEELHSRRLFQE